MSETDGPGEIRVLKGLEAVRKRPGMYIGGTGVDGVHDLVWEVVGNTVDLHLHRLATELHVELSKDGWCTVRDDGPGIPIDPVPRTGISVLETIITQLHSGATYDGHSPHVHLTRSLLGYGLVVVNALSTRIEVETTRNGERWAIACERGEVASPLRSLGPPKLLGTTVRFRPDPEIFKRAKLDGERIEARLQQIAWLLPFLRVSFQSERLRSRGGLLGWVDELADRAVARFAFCRDVDDVRVDLALAWTDGDASDIRCFVNLGETVGGTHVEGLFRGFAMASPMLLALGHGEPSHEVGSLDVSPGAIDTARAALEPGLVAIIHVGLLHPRWGHPNKEQLLSPEAGEAVARGIAGELSYAIWRDMELRDFLRARLE